MPGTSSSALSAGPLWRSRSRRDQFAACLLAAACLAGSALLRPILMSRLAGDPSRPDVPALVAQPANAAQTFSSLAVTFPRLTLGGFRGIISAALWERAEDDKTDRKWMDLETKYDIIAALQPYFTSVYVYHSWNQAYNLSAQWHEQDTKYKWILDGLDYLYRGETYVPNSPNLVWEEGNLYFLKLGGAYERIFYRAHWRADIARFHELHESTLPVKSDATEALRRVYFAVIPQPPDNAREYFHARELPDPTGRTSRTGWGVEIRDPTADSAHNIFSYRKDGKKPGDPVQFRYGLSPFYFAYCEFKRALIMRPIGQDIAGPTSLAPAIADSWPPMALRLWCRDDLYYTGQIMRRLFGEEPATAILGDPEALAAKINEADDCLRNVDMIAPKAVDFFAEHLAKFPGDRTVHVKHAMESLAYIDIAVAERKLLHALLDRYKAKNQLTEDVRRQLTDAHAAYDKAIGSTDVWVDSVYPFEVGQPANPDRADFEKYSTALKMRRAGIEKLLSTGPNDKPDMTFLNEEVVEK